MIGSIIFYDCQKSDLKGWFEYTLDWMKAEQFEPNTMGLIGRPKYMTFKGGQKILKGVDFQIEHMEFLAGGEPKTDAGWKLASSYSAKEKRAFVCFYEDTIPFEESIILKLTSDLTAFCKPKYGFAFLRSTKNKPNYYALGLGTGLKWPQPGPEKEEHELVQKWQEVYEPWRSDQIYKTGDLRDVYPYNFICQAHLDRIVQGITLKQFINQPGHGTLQPLTDTLWTWKLSTNEESQVREELRDTGILLCV